ncbi:MAG: hypothetical protein CSA50_07125 [Gammaproteobacteria bacterium]|nr:MAG: hypothetical protein CSA50_07125 [Gammaproteobacteria bacterium]
MLTYKSPFTLIVLLVCSCFVVAASNAIYAADEPKDVRVLIDISGSMKKNDPNNLRIPAVNLLTELIPDGNKAGVWTFGQYVNMLVKHDVVDDRWRKMAKQKANQINSVALFTNIGSALEKAADNLFNSNVSKDVHFILLTDGMVDIDRDPAKNYAERERILSDIVRKFKNAGAVIHTIALSKNADSSFLNKLSVHTNGASERAESASDLTRIFARTFDQAVPAEQVPIEGNRFDIDSSVEELTALIFRQPGSREASLIEPSRQRYNLNNKPDYVRWYQDAGYDWITVKRPFEGTWIIDADLLPDSRVTVVSHLQLKVQKLPVNFFAGDMLDLVVSLEEKGETITAAEFLKVIDVDLKIRREDGKSGTKRLSDPNNPPVNGIYQDKVSKLSTVGQYEVNVLVDGKTFKRKNRQIVNLRSPLDVELSVAPEADQPAAYNLVVSPLSEDIDLSRTRVAARITAPNGTSKIEMLPLSKRGDKWQMKITPKKGDGAYRVDLKVQTVNTQGNSFKFAPRSFDAVFPIDSSAGGIVSIPEPETEPEKSVTEGPPSEPEPVIAAPTEVPENLEQDAPLPESESGDDAMLFILGGVAAVLAVLGAAVFWFIKRKKKSGQDSADSGDREDASLAEASIEESEIDQLLKTDESTKTDEPTKTDESVDLDDVLDYVDSEPEAMAPETDRTNEPETQGITQFDTEPEPEEDYTSESEIDALLEDLSDSDEVIDDKKNNDSVAEILADGDPDDLATEPSGDMAGDQEVTEDDDEEFNLEDFDISDTDDLILDDDKKQ